MRATIVPGLTVSPGLMRMASDDGVVAGGVGEAHEAEGGVVANHGIRIGEQAQERSVKFGRGVVLAHHPRCG
jgi:predicted Zn-dependent protease